jgi:hypothetical protein
MACADLNADGGVDLSDAVYLLQCLFTGGPCPECEPPAPAVRLLPTGQMECYDEFGMEIPCDSEACPGQDGFHRAGFQMEDRFIVHGNGTVTDLCTRLMWKQDPAPEAMTWCEALDYCDDLTFAEHGDWRLPNIREILSIVDFRYIDNLCFVPVFGVVPATYWSSTSSTLNNYASASTLILRSGVYPGVWANPKGELHNFLAVRGGVPAP